MDKIRNSWITAAVAVAVAVLTAYGTMIVSLDSRMFEAQAQMVTQDQLRFELTQSNDRVAERLETVESLLFILLEKSNAPVQ